MTPRGTATRVFALVALGCALALAGCGHAASSTRTAQKPEVTRESSASPDLSATETAALLDRIVQAKQFSEPLFTQAQRLLGKLNMRMDAAPFVCETTVTLPGILEPEPAPAKAPGGNPTVPDAYEPDGTWQRASSLPVGNTQVRTITGPGDIDWIKVPREKGQDGWVYIVPSGAYSFYEESSPSPTPDYSSVTGLTGPGIWFVDHQKSTDTSPYEWIQLTARQPITYSIAHLRIAPPTEIGAETPQDNSANLITAVQDLSTKSYYEQTGRHATKAQLQRLRTAWFGKQNDYGSDEVYPEFLEGRPLQRWQLVFGNGARPMGIWTLSVRRGEMWIIAAAGRDASFDHAPYAEMFADQRKILRSSLHVPDL